MNVRFNNPPRLFSVGYKKEIQLKDCGRITLEPDEQVTFLTESGGEYDVVRKSWGFYATPSLNRRLKRFGLRGSLVKNQEGTFYILLVERGKETEFQQYLDSAGLRRICWLDDTGLGSIERICAGV